MKSQLTNKQIKAIHVAARRLGLIDRDGDDQHYRLVLRNICRVDSSLAMTQSHFDRLNRYFTQLGCPMVAEKSADPVGPTSRQRWRIEKLIKQLNEQAPFFNLAGVIHKITRGAATTLDELTTAETRKVIDALENIMTRHKGDHHVATR
jgi:hypothetical protein